ncbi:MAG: extracellular solute-binding protein [Clostridiales bacterium]|nr:extracellular solute-binding protein [Clostridiales bacterium]
MKKNRIQKLLALVLAMAMAMSLLTACGGSSSSGDTSAEIGNTDQTEFYIMGGQSSLSSGYDDNEVLNQLQEDAGISITWETMSESLSEQVNIKIAGGDLPDAFMGVGFSNYDLTTYGEDGTFIDLTPYITEEYMPNLTAILEEHPEIRAAITMDDGCIYGLPSAEQMGTAGIGDEEDYSIYAIPQYSMINKAWLDYLGLDVPTTLDELHDCLVAFAENDMSATYYGNDAGSTIPMSTGFDEWCWGQNIFYAGFGFTNWDNGVCNDLVLNSDGTCSFVCVSDNYREALTYFHDWYAECLMGDYADDYVFLPILEGPDGTYNVTLRDGGGTDSGNLSITEACESPANLLKFFDSWYDGEIVMQLQYGAIGTYFTEQDESGKWVSITEEESQELYGKGAGELKSTLEVYGPKLILSEYYDEYFYMEDRAIERLTDLSEYWMDFVTDTTTYPIDCVFTSEELDIIDQYKTDFQDTVAEQEGLWLKNGGPTDEEWEAYKSNLSATCGMDELLQCYQDAYDRYAENAEE